MRSYDTVDDFLFDDTFRAWVGGDPQATAYWERWRADHPDKLPLLNQAKAIVYAAIHPSAAISSEEVDDEVTRLLQQVRARRQAEAEGPAEAPVVVPDWGDRRRTRLQWAASVLLVLGVGLGYWLFREGVARPASAYRRLLTEAPVQLTEKANDTGEPLTLVLSDGSAVTLEKNSRISYPDRFSGSFREIYLEGEAFFEVAHNPRKPFLVYANETVTRVLGTSFRIKAFENDAEVKVAVRTGKVTVYARTAFRKDTRPREKDVNGVLLLPNQEAAFNRRTENLHKGLVEKPELVATAAHIQEITVEDVPVTEVFRKLEKAYGIDIVYNEDVLARCPITASFSDETLYDKLHFICQVIGADYEVLDGQIIINSRGCRP